jgi:hypothetical protein
MWSRIISTRRAERRGGPAVGAGLRAARRDHAPRAARRDPRGEWLRGGGWGGRGRRARVIFQSKKARLFA